MHGAASNLQKGCVHGKYGKITLRNEKSITHVTYPPNVNNMCNAKLDINMLS